jgi:predicted patatin/cPLA2 family phospholipase
MPADQEIGAAETSRMTHSVLDLLRARATTSPPYSDGARVALVIEGGGMRGVVSAGMAEALARHVPPTAFDDIYGSSAGALNGAFYIAGQANVAPRIYETYLTSPSFLSLRHLLKRRPIMSLEYLVDTVLEHLEPLDWQAVLASPVRLHPIAASVDRFRAVDLSGAKTKEDLKQRLVAAARMPLVAGPPVEVDGERFLDSSLYESVPVRRAAEDGATHVLALRTRPRDSLRSPPSAVERLLISRKLNKLDPRLGEAYNSRAAQYRFELDSLAYYEDGKGSGCLALAIYPPPDEGQLSQFARSPEKVSEAAAAGERAAAAVLGSVLPQLSA